MIAVSRFSFLNKKRMPTKATIIMQRACIKIDASSPKGIVDALDSSRVDSIRFQGASRSSNLHANSSTRAGSRYHKMALRVRGNKTERRE